MVTNFAVLGRSSASIVPRFSCFKGLRPEFFTRMVMVASSPGVNSLMPFTEAENEGAPPRNFVAADTGAIIRALHRSTVKIMIAVPAEPEKPL
jgi:hypothetical protein